MHLRGDKHLFSLFISPAKKENFAVLYAIFHFPNDCPVTLLQRDVDRLSLWAKVLCTCCERLRPPGHATCYSRLQLSSIFMSFGDSRTSAQTVCNELDAPVQTQWPLQAGVSYIHRNATSNFSLLLKLANSSSIKEMLEH